MTDIRLLHSFVCARVCVRGRLRIDLDERFVYLIVVYVESLTAAVLAYGLDAVGERLLHRDHNIQAFLF